MKRYIWIETFTPRTKKWTGEMAVYLESEMEEIFGANELADLAAGEVVTRMMGNHESRYVDAGVLAKKAMGE